MNSFLSLKRPARSGQIAVFALAFGLSACNHAESGKEPETRPDHDALAGISFSFDAAGEMIIKDASGKPIGDKCSPDPKSPDVCPIFKPGHKVQVEQAIDMSAIRYKGSPQCMAMLINGTWYVLPSAAFCNK